MKKSIHRYRLYVTDEARLNDFTRWRLYDTYATRKEAWTAAKRALLVKYYHHVKVIEDRVYTNPN